MSKQLDERLSKLSKEEYLLHSMRHTAEHVLHTSMQNLYPKLKKAMGPAIEDGFYCDFDLNDKISEDDFGKIEKEMKKLIDLNLTMVQEYIPVAEAKKIFRANQYKMDWIEQIGKRGEKVSIYKMVDKSGTIYDLDLCSGPHLESTGKVGPFTLLRIAGAYWHGDEKNKMLTRIYGTCFPTKEELDTYLWRVEEAKKRDHRKLGKELDLFVFSDLVGKGLPLFTPKGTILRELLNDFSQKLRLDRGFQKVWIPHITKDELYKISGHWDKFGDELFLVKSQETDDQMVLKPMNCPHHQQIYASKPRSYKDLPLKYLETTTIYRDEKDGEMIGLSRVRSVTQDDSHSFCLPEQIEEIYNELIEITKIFFDRLGMKYKARISLRDPKQPEKYLGDVNLWEKAQKILIDIAKKNQLDYYVAEGEAAFYGPKIDFMVLDALGREWQLATPQLDFVQPKRFGLTYVDQHGKEQTPVMIHYALMGSIERFLSVYIEHTAGAFPLWLSPIQIMILPVSDKFQDYGIQVKEILEKEKLRVELNADKKPLGAKIRETTLQKVPYMVIIGNQEFERYKVDNVYKVAVRTREGKDLGLLDVDEFVRNLKDQIEKFQ